MMRQKCHYLVTLLQVLSVIMFSACSNESAENNPSLDANSRFTLNEAKNFLGKRTFPTTRSSPSTESLGLYPGEYTPLWKMAQSSCNDQFTSIEVAIQSQLQLQVRKRFCKKGVAYEYYVPVWQKLVLIKNHKKNHIFGYLLSMIPTKTFYEKHRNDGISSYQFYSKNNIFSGRLVLSRLDDKATAIDVVNIKDGRHIARASIFDKRFDRAENIVRLKTVVDAVRLKKCRALKTRASWWGDGDDGDDGDNEGDEDDKDDKDDKEINGGEIPDVIITPDNDDDDPWSDDDDPWSDDDDLWSDDDDLWDDNSDYDDGDDEEQEQENAGTNADDGKNSDKDLKERAKKLAERIGRSNKLSIALSMLSTLPCVSQIAINHPIALNVNLTTHTYSISYQEVAMYEASDLAVDIALIHEAYHISQFLDSDSYDSNYDYHSEMVDDQNLIDALKNAFPDHDDDWYDSARWAGNQESEKYQNLSDEKRNELDEFFHNNTILH